MSMLQRLPSGSELKTALYDFLFPPLCCGCGSYTDAAPGICESCEAAINPISSPICLECDSSLEKESICSVCKESGLPMFAVGEYGGPMKEIIGDIKFQGVKTPFHYFSQIMASKYQIMIAKLSVDWLIPIPLHPGREYYRGYNQARRFAVELSNMLLIEIRDDLLFRDKKRRPQSKLGLSMRESNIRDVFRVTAPEAKGRILLVDDVVTSGSTAREAARTLRESGISPVGLLTIAHAR